MTWDREQMVADGLPDAKFERPSFIPADREPTTEELTKEICALLLETPT